MANCEACNKNEAVHHVTVTVSVFSPKSTRRKVVQFWLCNECEIGNRQILADDHNRRQRVALRLSQDPEFFSRWRRWRASRQSAAAATK